MKASGRVLDVQLVLRRVIIIQKHSGYLPQCIMILLSTGRAFIQEKKAFATGRFTALLLDTQRPQERVRRSQLSHINYLLSGVLIARLATWSIAPLDSCSKLHEDATIKWKSFICPKIPKQYQRAKQPNEKKYDMIKLISQIKCSYKEVIRKDTKKE